MQLYNQQGEKIGTYDLPEEIFGVKVNMDLVHQVLVAQMANRRKSIAHTKTRGEISGGGKKPWRQKGTGRARHGSIRSPLWRHGGTTFGPRNDKIYARKITKKMKRKALFMVLSGKVKDEDMIMVDKLELSAPKTKEMFTLISNLFEKTSNVPKALIVLPSNDKLLIRSTKNLPNVQTLNSADLNIADLLSYKSLLMTKDSVDIIKKTFL